MRVIESLIPRMEAMRDKVSGPGMEAEPPSSLRLDDRYLGRWRNASVDYFDATAWNDPEVAPVADLVRVHATVLPDGDPIFSFYVDIALNDGRVLPHYERGFPGHPINPRHAAADRRKVPQQRWRHHRRRRHRTTHPTAKSLDRASDGTDLLALCHR